MTCKTCAIFATIKIPTKFYDDHIQRAENPKEWINAIQISTKSSYTVALTRQQWNELYADASFYSEVCDYQEYKSLQKSAQRTQAIMWKGIE